MISRRSYQVNLIVNGRQINEVIIDPHYELKHSESVNDKIILALVQKLDGREFEPDDVDAELRVFQDRASRAWRKDLSADLASKR